MQYIRIMNYANQMKRGVRATLQTGVKGHGHASPKGRGVSKPVAEPDGWVRNNTGARAQSDFWLQMLAGHTESRPSASNGKTGGIRRSR